MYETVTRGSVVMENNEPCKIAGIDKVRINIFDGTIRTLGLVRHVISLNRSIISLSTFDSKEYKYTGKGGVLKVSKGVGVMLKGRRKS